jgi:polyketide cyclase/dehydrase/lipid transport protein
VTVVRVERIVQRPPEQVFDFVATRNFDNHPRWDPGLLEMRQTSPGPVRLGTTAHVIRRQGRRRVEGTATVIKYEPCRRAAWDVRFGTFALRQAVDLLPQQSGSATRLRLCIETHARAPVSFLLPLLRPRFRRTMTRSLATIDELVGQDNP